MHITSLCSSKHMNSVVQQIVMEKTFLLKFTLCNWSVLNYIRMLFDGQLDLLSIDYLPRLLI